MIHNPNTQEQKYKLCVYKTGHDFFLRFTLYFAIKCMQNNVSWFFLGRYIAYGQQTHAREYVFKTQPKE